MAKTPAEAKTPPLTFETAITRLETLVAAMDLQNLPLVELLNHYEEGSRLVKLCEERLQDAEKRIELITRDPRGKLASVDAESMLASSAAPVASAPVAAGTDVSLF